MSASKRLRDGEGWVCADWPWAGVPAAGGAGEDALRVGPNKLGSEVLVAWFAVAVEKVLGLACDECDWSGGLANGGGEVAGGVATRASELGSDGNRLNMTMNSLRGDRSLREPSGVPVTTKETEVSACGGITPLASVSDWK